MAAKIGAAYNALGGEKQFRKEMDAVAETIAWVELVLDEDGRPVEGLDPVSLGQKLSPLEGSLQYIRQLLESSGVMAALDERFPELVSELLQSGALSVEEAQVVQVPGLDVSAAETRKESAFRRYIGGAAPWSLQSLQSSGGASIAQGGGVPRDAQLGGRSLTRRKPSEVFGQTAGMFQPKTPASVVLAGATSNPPALMKLMDVLDRKTAAPWQPTWWTVVLSITAGARQTLGAAAENGLAHASHSERVIATAFIIGVVRLMTELERILRQE